MTVADRNQLDLSFIRSDFLKNIWELCGLLPSLEALVGPIPKPVFIVDANCVFSTLHWLFKRRRDDAARTSFQELLDSGAIVAIAPPEIEEQVERHLEERATRWEIPETELKTAWVELRKKIRICSWTVTRQLPNQEVDPSDHPYIYSQGSPHLITRPRTRV